MKKFNQSLLVISITAMLTACGGGSSGTNSNIPNNPTAPSNPNTPSIPSTSVKSITASLVNHSNEFLWEQNTPIKLSVVDQDNKPVEIEKCFSDDQTLLTIASDCSNLTSHRIQEASFTVVSKDGAKTNVIVSGVPVPSTLPVNSSGGNSAGRIINDDHQVLAWGDNTSNQLATKTSLSLDYSQYPDFVTLKDGTILSDIYQIAQGYSTVYALNKKGQVYGWGQGVHRNTASQQHVVNYPEFILNAAGKAPLNHIVKISTSGNDTGALALTDEGRVMMFGFSNNLYPTYVKKDNLPLTNIKNISLGGVSIDGTSVANAYAVDDKGQVYHWQIDLNNNTYDVKLVVDKNGTPLTGVSKVVAGIKHVLALTDKGYVYSWGSNSTALGDESLDQSLSYIKYATVVNIKGQPLTNIKDIALNFGSSYALTNNGNVYAWGNAPIGQLGDGINNPLGNGTSTPTLVVSETGTGELSNINAITGSIDSAFALKADGSLVGWGSNWNGLLTQDNPQSGKYYRSPVVIYKVKDQPLSIKRLTANFQ